MAHDPLATLVKVRRLACEGAMRKLALTLESEQRVLSNMHQIERSIADEMEAAADPAGSDAAVEAFGLWLPTARKRLEAARCVLNDRQAETVRVRAELTACRTALEIVETLRAERERAAQQLIEKRAMQELEDRPIRPTGAGDHGAENA